MAFWSRTMVLLWAVMSSVLWSGVRCYPSGAPTGVCDTMLPNHPGTEQALSDNPYGIDVSRTSFMPGGTIINVTLTGIQFIGVFLQARMENGDDTPVGTFISGSLPGGLKTLECENPNDAVTHTNNNSKADLTVQWVAPNQIASNIQFV